LQETNDSEKSLLIYSNEFTVCEKSKLKVTVIESYFRGNHYLIQAEMNPTILFFESEVDIPKQAVVFLKVDPKIIQSRL
jgi:iron(III) transport system ATP-binding protein